MDDSSSLFLLLIVFFVLVYESSDVPFAFRMLICVRQSLHRLVVHSLHVHGPRHHPRVQIFMGHVCPRCSVSELVHRSFQTGWDERRRGVGDGSQEFQVSINERRKCGRGTQEYGISSNGRSESTRFTCIEGGLGLPLHHCEAAGNFLAIVSG